MKVSPSVFIFVVIPVWSQCEVTLYTYIIYDLLNARKLNNILYICIWYNTNNYPDIPGIYLLTRASYPTSSLRHWVLEKQKVLLDWQPCPGILRDKTTCSVAYRVRRVQKKKKTSKTEVNNPRRLEDGRDDCFVSFRVTCSFAPSVVPWTCCGTVVERRQSLHILFTNIWDVPMERAEQYALFEGMYYVHAYLTLSYCTHQYSYTDTVLFVFPNITLHVHNGVSQSLTIKANTPPCRKSKGTWTKLLTKEISCK